MRTKTYYRNSDARGFRLPLLIGGLLAYSSIANAQSNASSPPPGQSQQYTELVARSASITPEQKAKAQQLFSTGFMLWQSGDFGAATVGFQKGLEIDPANGPANYYLGDCLLRAKQRKEAIEHLTRASILGNGSAESLKAESALRTLSKPPTIDEMSLDELKNLYVGTWFFEGLPSHQFTIFDGGDGKLQVKGAYACFPIPPCAHFKNLSIDGRDIHFLGGAGYSYIFHLTSPTRFEGDQSGGLEGAAHVSAIKKY